jgi:hypothetical protein
MSSDYETAIIAFERHVRRTDEGYFRLDVEDGREIGIADPVIFADLKRSLDETNRKIKLGQIDPSAIMPYPM